MIVYDKNTFHGNCVNSMNLVNFNSKQVTKKLWPKLKVQPRIHLMQIWMRRQSTHQYHFK